MAKIFLSVHPRAACNTGASGYIGSDLLHLLAKSHPQYQVRALVRDAAKGEEVKKSFSQVQVVKGSLDDIDLIAQEAKDADVVLREKPPYWIQIPGGSMLAAPKLADKFRVSGTGSDTVYNDLLALVAPATIYGQGTTESGDQMDFASVELENCHLGRSLDALQLQPFDLKLLANKGVDQVSGEEADKLLPHGSVLYGTNARGRAHRAETVLGWKPQEENLEHDIE
ncbi:hypothetical protein B0T10DRAFT_467903 [Thelonectria olida]|uniref:NAD(P)-binding domain-containing protein n=1 Tax=Thelonectria olida TaxID=1576542 RepID=A0A9P8VP14_9HYPO|nr:hypothetical protein B0T10DRAFT_467903 [Thelonectria olida]